jgi:hypothetical protein
MSTDFLTPALPYIPYVLVSLVGIVMGLLYVLYGWKASDKDVKIQEAARVKNFLWIAAGAFIAFIADFKAIDANAQKPALFGFYLAAAILTLLLTLFAWAAWIAVSASRIKRRHPDQYPDEPFHPVSDFLFYGYQHYQKQFKAAVETKAETKSNRYEQWTRRFLPHYTDSLAVSLDLAQSRLRQGQLHRTEVSLILGAICAVIKSVYEDKQRDIYARFLRAYPAGNAPQQILEQLRFARADRSEYEYYLASEASSLDAKPETITLPVERRASADRSLPGAPLAFTLGEDQLHDEVRRIEYPPMLETEIQTQVRKYFEAQGFRSLSSFVLKNPANEKFFGTLTIESSHSHNLGDTPEQQKELKKLLKPFVLALEIAAAP